MLARTRPALDWDDANREHLARHKVTPNEVEEVLFGGSLPIAADERSGEERHTELGATAAGRLLVVVWTWRRRKIRVVTAFPANRKWRRLWRGIKGRHNAEEKTGPDADRG